MILIILVIVCSPAHKTGRERDDNMLNLAGQAIDAEESDFVDHGGNRSDQSKLIQARLNIEKTAARKRLAE